MYPVRDRKEIRAFRVREAVSSRRLEYSLESGMRYAFQSQKSDMH